MKYKSISVQRLYAAAAILTGAYIFLSVISYSLFDVILNPLASDKFILEHPETKIKLTNKLLICLAEIVVWIPYFKYVMGCMELGFSEKRCRKTFKAAPALWLLGFLGEHIFVFFKARIGVSYLSEGWVIHKAEYLCFFFGILNIASLVVVCTSAALGLDEIRHVDHMK